MNARRRIKRIRAILEQVGMEPDRVQMYQLSSAMAGEFAAAVRQMTEIVERLGRNPLEES